MGCPALVALNGARYGKTEKATRLSLPSVALARRNGEAIKKGIKMEITTKSGIKFEIDTEDYEKVKAYFWYAQKLRNTFYISAMALSNGQRKRIWLHRLITNAPDGFDVDHADGNGLNNVRTNLRICSRAQNAANRRPNSRSSSKFKGVSWRERDKRWRASIRANGNRKWIGYFKTEKEAALAYNEQAKVLHGEFARLNVL